jgi:NADP-dependent alcohol dehydrogenase
MNNFIFHNPVKLIFGEGQISRLSQEIPQNARIMMTYGGGSIFRNGVYEQVKSALAGRQVVEFGGIEPNPRYETLMKAVEIIRSQNLDFILAVGGGSVVDGTKFIAAAVPYRGDAWDIPAKGAKIKEAIPFGCVLTLPATGSEMNANSVISHEALKDKKAFAHPLLYPKFSITDPATTFSLPPAQVANGIIDTFVHTTEQYLTYPVNAPLQDRLAESILLTLIEEGPKAMAVPRDYPTRANIMWCATMALNGIIGLGVPSDWATHMIGHQLTALHGLDHAVTLAIVLPGVLRVMQHGKKEKLMQYADRVWGIKNLPQDEAIEEAITRTDVFFRSLGVNTSLTAYGIRPADIDAIVDRFQGPPASRLGERGLIGPAEIKNILENRLG